MGQQAVLLLRADSEGIALANQRLRETPAAAADAEKAATRYAEAQARAAARQVAAAELAAERGYQAYLRAEQKEEQGRQRATERAAAEYQKRQSAYERQWRAAEQAAEKQAAAAERAAKRESDAWTNAIQKTKARLEREGIGRDGVLPIRPSLQRIEARINQQGQPTSGLGAMLKGVGEGSMTSIAGMVGVAGLAGGAVAIGEKITESLGEGIHKVIEAAVEMDNLRARITGVTGASDEAGEKLEELESMTLGKLPSTVRQVAESFIYLSNTGLDASASSLKSYSNIAAQTGTTIGDVARAVQMATLGNYRSLREFGIKAKEEGDHVNVTFRGVTSEVANNSEAVQEYFRRLGNTAFAGAAERQMDTMGGAIKKVSDGWEKLADTVAKSSLGEAIKESIGVGSTLVEMLNASVYALFDTVDKKYEDAKKKRRELESDKLDAVMRSWADPSVSRSELENAAETIAGGRMSDKDKRLQQFQKIDDILQKAKNLGETQAGGFSIDQLVSENLRQYQSSFGEKTRSNRVDPDIAKYKQALDAVDPLAKASREYDERKRLYDKFAAANSDAHRQLTAANQDTYQQEVDKFIESQTKEVDEVLRSLHGEEVAIEESYRKRADIIERQVANPRVRAAIVTQLEWQRNQQREAMQESQIRQRQELSGFAARPEEKLQWEYQAQLRKIAGYQEREDPSNPFAQGVDKARLGAEAARQYRNQRNAMAASRSFERADLLSNKHDDAVQLAIEEGRKLQEVEDANNRKIFDSEREHQQAIFNVRQEFARKSNDLALQYSTNTVNSAEAMFGSLATAAKNWKGEQSSEYAALFAVQKGFAIASAGLNAAKALSEASAASPWYAKIPAMVSAMADAARIVAMISSTSYSGAYDAGGYIPSGQVGLVGERRTEIVSRPSMVQGPAYVTGGADTARMMSGGGGGSQVMNVRIMPTAPSRDRYRSSSRNEHVIGVALQKHPELLRLGG
jgi:hypothetical protein